MHYAIKNHIKIFCFLIIYTTRTHSHEMHNILAGFNQASFGVHAIAEELESWQSLARNSLAHSRMCRGDGIKEPPLFLLQGAIDSLAEENRRYPSDAGFSHTRGIILEFIEKTFGIHGLTIDNLCPNNGVSDGFAKSIAILLKKYDVVVSFAPTFGLHSRTVNSFGGRVIPIDVLNKKNFLPTIAELEEHIIKINESCKTSIQIKENNTIIEYVPRVKLLNLINPSNPLGHVITDTVENRNYYKKIFHLAEKYNFMIFDDLVYWGTEYDQKHQAMPFLTAVPEAKDRVIMAFGPSKSIGGARMRAGMIVAPTWFIAEMRKVILNINSGISAFNQYVMAAAFNMIHEFDRKEFFAKNAKEYSFRRDVCITGLLGKNLVLQDPKYNISMEKMKDIEKFLEFVGYAQILLKEYNMHGLPSNITETLSIHEKYYLDIRAHLLKEPYFANQTSYVQEAILQYKFKEYMHDKKLPNELYILNYIVHKELKNKSNIQIPKIFLPFLENLFWEDALKNFQIPPEHKQAVNEYVNNFTNGTKFLKIYSIPQATFFLTIDASAMIGRCAIINIMKIANTKINHIKDGCNELIEPTIARIPLEAFECTPIQSSKEIDLLCSWIGGHNYISGELMNVAPEKGLLRMTFAEPPIIFCEAIDSMRYVENFIL